MHGYPRHYQTPYHFLPPCPKHIAARILPSIHVKYKLNGLTKKVQTIKFQHPELL